MNKLFSQYCHTCEGKVVIGVVDSMVAPRVDIYHYCPHCGSSNTRVAPEENVLESNYIPKVDMNLGTINGLVVNAAGGDPIDPHAMSGHDDKADAIATGFREVYGKVVDA